MTKLEIVRKAFGNAPIPEQMLIRLFDMIELVREEEREACADVCDREMEWGEISRAMAVAAGNCADAIRARGDK